MFHVERETSCQSTEKHPRSTRQEAMFHVEQLRTEGGEIAA